MDNPRPEKVAVVDEVRQRLEGSAGVVVTEYRGLTVGQLEELRQGLAPVGGDYKIFKNTLVRRAVDGSPYESLSALLTGPTALAFVEADPSAVAKALRDFARAHPQLVVKGGMSEGRLLSSSEVAVLADLPSREVLLARVAGAISAPLSQFAGLLQALPRSLAYGLSALLDQRRSGQEAAGGVLEATSTASDAGEATEAAGAASSGTEPSAAAPVDGEDQGAGAEEPGSAADDVSETGEAEAQGAETGEAEAQGAETGEAEAQGAETGEAGEGPAEGE